MKPAFDVSPPSGRSSGFSINIPYILSIPGIVKIIEFMLLMFSFALALNYKQGLQDTSIMKTTWGILNFHLLISITAWLGSFILFLVYLCNGITVLQNKFKNPFLALSALHISGVVFLLISTSLVLHDCLRIQNYVLYSIGNRVDICEHISRVTPTSCAVYQGAGAAGFFAILFVCFDAVLHVWKWWTVRGQLNDESCHVAEIRPSNQVQNEEKCENVNENRHAAAEMYSS